MVEPIGNPCDCIYEFDRHYILLALDKLIMDTEKELNQTKQDLFRATEEEKKSLIYQSLQGAEGIYDNFFKEAQVVKKRVLNTKVCERMK